jgi:hypothetical protein
MAKSCLDYRSDRLQKAAKSNRLWLKERCIHGNLMIGEEATPYLGFDWDFEQHITADVSIAFWNYYVHTR